MSHNLQTITSAFAPGKVIISGDHSVVYGYPAVTMALPIGIEVELSSTEISSSNSNSRSTQEFSILLNSANPVIAAAAQILIREFPEIFSDLKSLPICCRIHSQLSLNSGMGSSSALAAALIRALAKRYQLQLVSKKLAILVWEVEKMLYPTASPIDPVTVALAGSLVFKKKDTWEWKSLPAWPASKNFSLVDSGPALETTAEMVAKVKEFIDSNSKVGQQIIAELGQVTRKIVASISSKNFDPSLLTDYQRLLEKLPIVSHQAKKIITDIENNGGFAKITGAGGTKSGSGMILVWKKQLA
jgi:mevalonate kinase